LVVTFFHWVNYSLIICNSLLTCMSIPASTGPFCILYTVGLHHSRRLFCTP
jgi:hypothetical protein